MNKQRSISTRFIVYVLICASALSVVTTGLQLYLEYEREIDRIELQLDHIETTATASLVFSLWSFYQEQAQAEVHNIQQLPGVAYVEVITDQAVYAKSGVLDPHESYISRNYPLVYEGRERGRILVGELNVYTALKPVYQALLEHLGMILLLNTIKTILIALFITFLFDKIVFRHLRHIANYVSDRNSLLDAAPLQLKRIRFWDGNADDLFDDVVTAYNTMNNQLKTAYEEVKMGESRYRALIENNTEAIWRCEFEPAIDLNQAPAELVAQMRANGVIQECNAIGQSMREVAGQTISDTSFSAFPLASNALLKKLIQQNYRVHDSFLKIQVAGSEPRFLSVNLLGISENQQLVRLWGICSDITDKVLAEDRLLLSESRLEEAQSIAHLGYWFYDGSTDSIDASDEFYRIYGFDQHDAQLSWRQLRARIHPDDRDKVAQALRMAKGKRIEIEHRIVTPDGDTRYVLANARREYDLDGQDNKIFGILLDISRIRQSESDLKQSEQSLRESELQLLQAQKIAQMGHWVYSYQNREMTASDEFFRIYGYDSPTFTPTIKRFIEHVHIDDRDEVSQLLSANTLEPQMRDYRIMRADGEMRYMQGMVHTIFSKTGEPLRKFGVSMDITRRKLTELELLTSRERFEKIFTASPDAIILLDRSTSEGYCYLDVNPAFEQLTGYKRTQVLGKETSLFGLWRDQSQRNLMVEQLQRDGKVNNFEAQFTHSDGSILTVLLSTQAIQLDGVPGAVTIIKDLTELRALEAKSHTQESQLIQANKLASIGTLVAGVAHEVNNPNHLIQMNNDLLRHFQPEMLDLIDDYLEDEDDKPMIGGIPYDELRSTLETLTEDISYGAQRIARIVKDLKDFARPDETLEFSELAINPLIERTVKFLQPIIKKHCDNFTVSLCSENLMINGNPQHIEQVLVNLIVNGLQALDDNNQSISISTRANHLDQAIIEIRDTGCGIQQDQLQQIFDPFYTTRQGQGGTGLGLSICYRMIKDHKGTIEVESQIGEGTLMTIYLPLLSDHQ